MTKRKKLKNATKIKPDHRGHVLAEGEVTGHCHSIEACDDTELYKIGEELILANEKQATLKHQEHAPVKIKPGLWESGIVVEFDYLSKMERKVVD